MNSMAIFIFCQNSTRPLGVCSQSFLKNYQQMIDISLFISYSISFFFSYKQSILVSSDCLLEEITFLIFIFSSLHLWMANFTAIFLRPYSSKSTLSLSPNLLSSYQICYIFTFLLRTCLNENLSLLFSGLTFSLDFSYYLILSLRDFLCLVQNQLAYSSGFLDCTIVLTLLALKPIEFLLSYILLGRQCSLQNSFWFYSAPLPYSYLPTIYELF